MKKIVLIGVGGLALVAVIMWTAVRLAVPTALSAADSQTFVRANQLYASGQYDAAVNLYSQLIDQGVENPDVYYNLGRTYAALGNQVKASEQHAFAKALAPRDAAIAQELPPTNGFIPQVSQNELAIALLGVMCLVAFTFVLVRHRNESSDESTPQFRSNPAKP